MCTKIKVNGGTCTTVAQYALYGTTVSNSVADSIGASSQPTINFPSIALSGDTSKDPTQTTQGLKITYQKYLDITDKWISSGSGTSIYLWLYYNQGTIGYFAQIGLDNSSNSPKLVSLFTSGTTYQYFSMEIGTRTRTFKRVYYGWNLLVIELNSNYLYGKSCRYGSCRTYSSNIYYSSSGAIPLGTSFYLGCKSCTDLTVNYLIYSVQILQDTSTYCAQSPMSYTLTNSIYPCGDKIREGSEQCDDGNFASGDGCSDTCQFESGTTCSTNPALCGNCGNGMRSSNEECDDGNYIAGDGCSDICTTEDGWDCTGGSTTSKDMKRTRFNTNLSYCDDGNTVDGDGCSSVCAVESGYICTGGDDNSPDVCETCGDGIRSSSSSSNCDDGNTINGDGCSSTCYVEIGYSCTGGSLTSKDICKEICGDGKRYNTNITYCDDGNIVKEDGCSSTCSIENGWTCAEGTTSKADVCKEKCGDGTRFNTNTTYCDDGNNSDGDGCSSLCSIESEWKCSGGNSTQKDTCTQIVDQGKVAMGQAISGVAGGASAVFSFCNLSTPSGLWITMNQFQLILLLLLTKSSIPRSIVDYLSGLKATTCSFNFIPFKDIPGFNFIINYLTFSLPKKELDYFGIFSGSTFANNFSLICILLIFSSVHSLFLFIHRSLVVKMKAKKRCVNFLGKIYQFFAFNFYVRMLLEANQFLMLSSFSELYEFDTSSSSKIVSLMFAFCGFFICFGFISLSLINYIIHKNTDNMEKYIPLKEFFSGLKSRGLSKLYSTLLLMRRALFVSLLIFGQSFSNIGLICPMIIIQIIYLSGLTIVRPYKLVKDNIIEITNECFYFLLIVLLSYFNSKDRWGGWIENVYLMIILGNSMTIITIMTVAFTVTAIIKCRKRCKKDQTFPKEKEEKQNENEIRDFSSFKISNISPDKPRLKAESEVAFYEESKQDSTFQANSHLHTPTTNELYWQNYNSVDGGKYSKSRRLNPE